MASTFTILQEGKPSLVMNNIKLWDGDYSTGGGFDLEATADFEVTSDVTITGRVYATGTNLDNEIDQEFSITIPKGYNNYYQHCFMGIECVLSYLEIWETIPSMDSTYRYTATWE